MDRHVRRMTGCPPKEDGMSRTLRVPFWLAQRQAVLMWQAEVLGHRGPESRAGQWQIRMTVLCFVIQNRNQREGKTAYPENFSSSIISSSWGEFYWSQEINCWSWLTLAPVWRSREGNFADDVFMRTNSAPGEERTVQQGALGLCTIGFRKSNMYFDSVNDSCSGV